MGDLARATDAGGFALFVNPNRRTFLKILVAKNIFRKTPNQPNRAKTACVTLV
jgi:hypothetical protein